MVVTSQNDLKNLIDLKKGDPIVIGGFLGIEGAHCLEGKLENVQKLYNVPRSYALFCEVKVVKLFHVGK